MEEVPVLIVTLEVNDSVYEVVLCIDETEGMSYYGETDLKTNTIHINFQNLATVGELASTVLHEMCHIALWEKLEITGKDAENYIYPVQVKYICNLTAKSQGRPRHHDIRCPFTDDYINHHYDMMTEVLNLY
jgi:predicted SprT family Zn-dependent metalloprotease